MKTIIAVIIISILTAIPANTQAVKLNSVYEQSHDVQGVVARKPNPNVQTVKQLNSAYEESYDVQGFVARKKYLQERKKTQQGAPLNPLDNQAVQTAGTAPPPMDAKARYDAFLRSKGVDPNTIGAATVVNGRMVMPTIEEQYAARNLSWRRAVPTGSIEAQLARAQGVNINFANAVNDWTTMNR